MGMESLWRRFADKANEHGAVLGKYVGILGGGKRKAEEEVCDVILTLVLRLSSQTSGYCSSGCG